MAKVLLGIPTRSQLSCETSAYMAALSRRPDVSPMPVAGRPEDFCRNGLVRIFLSQPNLTHLFMLDSDIGPPLDALDRLLALDAPLAAGRYSLLMGAGLRWSVSNCSGGKYRLMSELPSYTEPFECDGGGAGCLLIRRDVFDKVKWPWFKWIENADGSQTSEDIYFFKKANLKGYRLKVDPAVICNHYKETNITALMLALTKNKKNPPANPDPQIINNQ